MSLRTKAGTGGGTSRRLGTFQGQDTVPKTPVPMDPVQMDAVPMAPSPSAEDMAMIAHTLDLMLRAASWSPRLTHRLCEAVALLQW